MSPKALLDRALRARGFHCLPLFTKQALADIVRRHSRARVAAHLSNRLAIVAQFIEPLAHHPSVPETDPALENLEERPDFIMRGLSRTANRGGAVFDDPMDFAMCCTELSDLRTIDELTYALGVEAPEEFGPTTWLDWAIEILPSRDYVSSLYCLASAWAYSPLDQPHDRAALIEADIMGATGNALHFMVGSDTSVKLYESWLGCSLRQTGSAAELRTALRQSPFGRISRVDTAAQLNSAMLLSLTESPDDEWNALALLEAWLDVPLFESDDLPQFERRIAESAVNHVQSARISNRIRTQLLDVVHRTRGEAVRSALANGLRHHWSGVAVPTSVAPLAEFSPVLLQLRVNATAGAPGADPAAYSAFAHEYLHFIQTVATTYNHNLLFDVLNFIRVAVDGLGGDSSLMIEPLSDVSERFINHLNFHRETLDGRYPSRAVSDYDPDQTRGWLAINPEHACYDYVRWNDADETFFATPLGAHAFQETLVFINEQFERVSSPNAVVLATPDTERVDSANHVYTAAWDLFLRTFHHREDSAVKKLATLAAILDMSLHLSPLSARSEANWIERTTPSYRFARIFGVLADIEFVDPKTAGDYQRFVEEVCGKANWPSYLEEIGTCVNHFARMRHEFTDRLDALVARDPAALEREIADRIAQFMTVGREYFGLAPEVIEEQRARFEHALRGAPIACLGILGLGLVDYLERSMRLRIEDPWAVILPYRNLERTLDQLPIPTWFWGTTQHGNWDSRTLALLYDMDRILHLFAIALQWEPRRAQREKGGFQCGFRLFNIPCADPFCQGACPDWIPGMPMPSRKTGFTYALEAHGLFPR